MNSTSFITFNLLIILSGFFVYNVLSSFPDDTARSGSSSTARRSPSPTSGQDAGGISRDTVTPRRIVGGTGGGIVGTGGGSRGVIRESSSDRSSSYDPEAAGAGRDETRFSDRRVQNSNAPIGSRRNVTLSVRNRPVGAPSQASLRSGTEEQEEEEEGTDQDTDFNEGDDDATSDNCTQCVAVRQLKRRYRVESIKADILRKLRLSAPPDMRGRVLPRLPHIQRLVDEINSQYGESSGRRNGASGEQDGTEGEVDDFHATTLKVIQFAQRAPAEVAVNDSSVCYFPLPPEIRRMEIVSATLSVYIRPSSAPSGGTNSNTSSRFDSWIFLYRLGPSAQREQRVRIRQKRIVVGGSGDSGVWHNFDIKTAIVWVIRRNLIHYGIQVQAADSLGKSIALVTPQNETEEVLKPYLMIQVKESSSSSSRYKRTTDRICDEGGTQSVCCRYPLQVDFSQFGWDFIIVPRTYPAYYCSGECPYLYLQQYTNTQFRQQSRTGVGGPCCTPRKFSEMSMIHYDEHMNIVHSKIPDMVVDSCGCA